MHEVTIVVCGATGQQGSHVVESLRAGGRFTLLTALRSGLKFRYSAPPALLMRIFVPEFYKMRRSFEQAGRPPFPNQEGIDQAMAALRELIPAPRKLAQHLAAQGFATRTLASP